MWSIMETGIYILSTNDGYRVTHSNLYTDLYGNYDDKTGHYILNVSILLTMFGTCDLISSVESAYERALSISRTVEETDNGIMMINYQKLSFRELVNANKEEIVT